MLVGGRRGPGPQREQRAPDGRVPAKIAAKIAALPKQLREPETVLADTGYFRAENVAACKQAGIAPLIAAGRRPHDPPLHQRFEPAPPAPENPTPVEVMAHRIQTPEGGFLCPTQTNPGAGIRRYQTDARIAPVFAAGPRHGARRVEPRHHGLEYQVPVRPRSRLTARGQVQARQAAERPPAAQSGEKPRSTTAVKRRCRCPGFSGQHETPACGPRRTAKNLSRRGC